MHLPFFLRRAACSRYLDLPAFSFSCALISRLRPTPGMNAAPLGTTSFLAAFGLFFPAALPMGVRGMEGVIYTFAFVADPGMSSRAANGVAVIGLL